MNSVLVEIWEAFTVSASKIIRDSFAKTKTRLLPLSPPNMITNTQLCVASIQTFSKGINQIVEDTIAPIKLLNIRANDPTVIIRAKVIIQQPYRNVLLQAAAYDTVQKQTVLPIQEMKIECMIILEKKKIKLPNEYTTITRRPDSTSVVYLTAVKWHNVYRCLRIGERRKRHKR